jgi:hypothetical protein
LEATSEGDDVTIMRKKKQTSSNVKGPSELHNYYFLVFNTNLFVCEKLTFHLNNFKFNSNLNWASDLNGYN